LSTFLKAAEVITKATASVRNQLWFAFTVVIALSFLSTAIAIWRLQVLADDTEALTQRPLVKERLISSWVVNASVAAKRTEAVARALDPTLAQFFADETRDSSTRTSELQTKIGELLDTDEEKAVYEQIGTARQQYTNTRDRVMALKAEGKDDAARTLFDQGFTPAVKTYIAKVNELLSLQHKSIDARTAQVLESAGHSADVLVALCLATLVFSVAAGTLFARALFRRLGGEPAAAAAVASEIARGNLRVHVPLNAGERTGNGTSLMAALERMRASLADIVGQVRQGTTTIGESIAVMANEAQDLSRRTESQAAALEETASSMEQLTQAINQSAASAEQANEQAAAASLVAQQGGAMVGQLVDTMGAINESSTRIVDIIAVIDGIAFQTNILALNAAVEAARAGEQGRGFAVVASEVRALAQRSASAAKEIKTLIDASTHRIADGSALAGRAGQTMQGIVQSIDRVTGIMNEIVSSSREQASGIGQVNQAITQMDGMTQQNAALVEESAAATRSMQEQANQLAQQVSLFQVGQEGKRKRPAAPVLAPVSAPVSAPASAPAAAARALPTAPRRSAPERPADEPVPTARRRAAAAPTARTTAAAAADDWEEF
jgi:methyl-accepting chemotaxis protein